jgi:tetratricopeptide (TPR) repeat protein
LLQRAGRTQEAEAQFRKALALFDAQEQATIDPQHYIEGWRRSYATRLPLDSPVMMTYSLAIRARDDVTIRQVIARAQQAGDIALTLRARAVIGGLLFDRGHLDAAAAELEDVLSEASERGLAQPEVGALLTLASVAQSGGELKRRPAQALCRARQLRALMISYLSSSNLDPTEREIELNDNGAIENQLGQYATELEIWTCAAEFFERAAQRSEAIRDHGRLANRLAGLRRAASRANDTKRAEAVASRLRSLLEKSAPESGRLVAARALAAHEQTRDPAAAHRYIEVAVQAAERIRATTPPAQRGNLDQQWNDVYWTLAEARREQGREEDAFAAVQLGKFRDFAETVAARAGVKIVPPSLAEVQSRLRPNEALVDIAAEKAGLALYLVRRDGFEAFAIPGDVHQLIKADAGDMRDA